MENSLSPAFVKINYQSPYAPHSMVVPSVPLTFPIGEGLEPSFDLRGGAIDVTVDGAIRDYVNIIKPLFLASTTFVDYVVFSQPGVGDVPLPVWSQSLGIVGTHPAAADDKATQITMSYRATDFTLFRQVFLDVPSNGSYEKVTNIDANPTIDGIRDYVVAAVTWIASRGGGRPNTFLSLTTTKNEKLRRSYRMT